MGQEKIYSGSFCLFPAASENQLAEARLFIERNIMSHVYTHALYPNGDGDILRDQSVLAYLSYDQPLGHDQEKKLTHECVIERMNEPTN